MTEEQIEYIPTLEDKLRDAREKFKEFLSANKNRKTPERFAILEEIYLNQHHFDAESLYIRMKQNSYRVSRATIYNTLDILVECGLVQRHQFGDNKTLYEKSYGFEPHDHFICSNCGKIFEFQSKQLLNIINSEANKIDFKVEHHALNIFGLCSDCH